MNVSVGLMEGRRSGHSLDAVPTPVVGGAVAEEGEGTSLAAPGSTERSPEKRSVAKVPTPISAAAATPATTRRDVQARSIGRA